MHDDDTLNQENLYQEHQIFKHITNKPSIAQTEYLTCQILFHMKNLFQFYIKKQYSLYFVTCIMPNKVLQYNGSG